MLNIILAITGGFLVGKVCHDAYGKSLKTFLYILVIILALNFAQIQ